MTLIQFPDRRTAPTTDDAACPLCGGMWFRPVRSLPEGELPGAVLLRADGSVQGYAGTMRCVDCGNDYKP